MENFQLFTFLWVLLNIVLVILILAFKITAGVLIVRYFYNKVNNKQ